MSGLINTIKTVSGFTFWPDFTRTLITWPSWRLGITTISSGASLPSPFLSMTMGPRLTESIHTVARSTVGAAGSSFDTRQPAAPSAPTARIP